MGWRDGQWGEGMGSGVKGWAVGWRDGEWGGRMGSGVEGWGMF